MLTHHEAGERARAAAPAGYRLHTITQARPGWFITRYVDSRWRNPARLPLPRRVGRGESDQRRDHPCSQ
ncbi:hypothetical protein [Kitasatospora sp. NPDC088134]|uniref:hypothetical protein n=1 Tax=Kitasatospora sp. NPDC088134 TaxID=3364071 RepID=UPI0037F50496